LAKLFKKKTIKKVAIYVIVIVLLTSFFLLFKLFFPNFGDPVYGNRLDGIEEVSLDRERLDDIKNSILTEEEVNTASISVKGTLVNIIINIEEEVDLIEAKTIATKSVTLFTNEEQNFYDIQIFITKEEEQESMFPIIGYKNKLSTNIVWNNIK
jgi:hypothetical protein